MGQTIKSRVVGSMKKVRKNIYEIIALVAIIHVAITLSIVSQGLIKNATITEIVHPPKVRLGETFSIQVTVQNLGDDADLTISAHMNAPPAYFYGEWGEAKFSLRAGEKITKTIEFTPRFSGVTSVTVYFELKTIVGSHLESKEIQIPVEE